MPCPAVLPAFLLSFLLGALPAAARQSDPERKPAPVPQPRLPTVTDLSFQVPVLHPEIIDPMNVARLQVSIESLLHATLDDTIRGTRPHVKAVFIAGVFLFDRTIAKVGHELGHMGVYSRAGYRDFQLAVGAQAPEGFTARDLFINSLTPFRRLSVGIPDDDQLDALQRFSPPHFEEFNAATFAGGMNQEQIHLNLYRDRVLRHQFGFLDTVPYTIETFSTLLYSGAENADLEGYRNHLEAAGFTTSVPRMRAISMVRLLSGSAASAASGFFRALTEEAYDGFAPRVIGQGEGWTVLWPEFESFLSRRGPTARASLPIRAGGFLIVPGLERSFAEGEGETEAGIEASRRLAPWLDARASFFAGTERGTWAEAGVTLKPSATASLSLSYHVADRYTFHREMYGETIDLIHRAERGLVLGVSLVFRF